MALEQKLQLRLAQKLVMTPSLQQAIKLLHMTRLELRNELTQELEDNPVLEESEELREEETSDESLEADEPVEADATDSMSDIDLEAYFSDDWEGTTSSSMYEMRQAPPIESTLTREPDLYDHLLWQLHMTELSATVTQIAEVIIGNLSPDGFLMASVDEICELGATESNVEGFDREEVESALQVVRQMDPPGIAYPDLNQSLLSQLDDLEVPEAALARRVIEEFWSAFLKRQFAAISKELGIKLSDFEPVVDLIKGLETRPGRKFSSDRAHYIEPDVYIAKVGNDYVVQLNDDGLPRLRVSRSYRSMLKKMQIDGRETEARQFIKEKLRAAIWLIKSIDQRQRTIYKVADSIIKQQRSFLDNGIEKLRPMVLRDVADDIGMHESTVSRVVSNKYMHTPRGLFPMKFFFHSGIDRDFGGDISSLTVKRHIQQMIDSEEPKHPRSDSELTRALKRQGINIARRTVAKYRDELNIPSSTNRKQIF
jgi:RNA polymerase sigma-54 factor